MAKKMTTTISRSPKLVSVHVSGITASSIGAERIKQAIEHNLACNTVNRCRDANQTVLDRVRCVEARAKRRIEGVNLRLGARHGVKIDVQEVDGGFEIFLTGANAAKLAQSYTDAELAQRLEIAVGCARTNKCGTVSQPAKGQLGCVAVGAKRRLGVQ